MTKTIFILAGGNDRTSQGFGKRLSQEIAKYVDRPRILSCFFSPPQKDWGERARDWKLWLADHFLQPFTYEYARYDALLDQIDDADVIFFHGGDTQLLLKTLPATRELKNHLAGKIVIGSSAGANMLSTCFWSSTRGVFDTGRGILHMNIMVHYGAPDVDGNIRIKEDWTQEEATFQERIGDQKITRLREGEFVVVEKKL